MTHKVVLAIWDDVYATVEWMSNSLKPLPCYVVGVVVEETDSYITLAGGVAKDGDYLTQISLPRGIIREIREIGEVNINELHEL